MTLHGQVAAVTGRVDTIPGVALRFLTRLHPYAARCVA